MFLAAQFGFSIWMHPVLAQSLAQSQVQAETLDGIQPQSQSQSKQKSQPQAQTDMQAQVEPLNLSLVQDIPPILKGAACLSPSPKEQVLQLRLYLRPNEALRFGQWTKDGVSFRGGEGSASLEMTEVKARYGRDEREISALRTYFEEQGLRVGAFGRNGLSVEVEGTVQTVEKAFHTQMARYEKDSVEFFANSSPIYLPREAARLVRYISGFDNFPRMRLASLTVPIQVAPMGYPNGFTIFQDCQEPAQVSFQLEDTSGKPLAAAGQSVELVVTQHSLASASPSVRVEGEGVVSSGSAYTAMTDESGQVRFDVTDSFNESVDLYVNILEGTAASGTATGETFGGTVLVAGGLPILTLTFYESLPPAAMTNTSFIPTDTVPTGQNLWVNLMGLPVRSVLHTIRDRQGQYSFPGATAVETKPQSEVPDSNGNAQLWLRLSTPVSRDEFVFLYTTGAGASTRYYGSKAVASWTGKSVVADGLTPEQVNSAYNAKGLVQKETLAPGANIAILASADWKPSDIEGYFGRYGLPMPNLLHRYVDTTGPLPTSGPVFQELELDIERAGSAAPGANLYIYAEPWDKPLLNAFSEAVLDNEASVIVSSIGMYESEMLPEEIQCWEDQMAMADALGITVIFASGDLGAYGNWNDPTRAETLFPDLPDITVVGGSQLAVDSESGAWSSEEGWSPDKARGGQQFWAGGGGFSQIYQRPDWQAPDPIQGYPDHRGVPDIALQASHAPGYATFIDGQWKIMAGTSGAAPTWAGYVGGISHQLHKRLGNMNPLLYRLAQSSQGASIFHRLTVGNNGYYSITEPSVWNPVTGLGSVNVGAFLSQVAAENLQGEAKAEIGFEPGTDRVGLLIGIATIQDGLGTSLSDLGLKAYQVRVEYDPRLVKVLTPVPLVGEAAVLNDLATETGTEYVTITASVPGAGKLPLGNATSGRLLFLPLNLMGSATEQTMIKVTLSGVLAQDGNLIETRNPSTVILQRGKILNPIAADNNVESVADCVGGLQYFAGTRKAGVLPGEVNLINLASVDSSLTTAAGQELSLADIIALLQYLAGLRDSRFERAH
jgi:hypothetical protein